MKSRVVISWGAAVLVSVAAFFILVRVDAQRQASFAAQKAEWERERADLQKAAERQPEPRTVTNTVVRVEHVPKTAAPEETLARLKQWRVGAGDRNAARQAVHLFEALADAGPLALPAIEQFLATRQDIEYEVAGSGSGRGRGARDLNALADSVVPLSLRFGLFDVLASIGGEKAQAILADALSSTGRGIEIAYLAKVLERMAPGRHRETALMAARDLLGSSVKLDSASPLDRFETDYLYGVLRAYHDTTFAAQAQASLVRADGAVDRSAVDYLVEILREQALPIAIQAYSDPRITDAKLKEPLARVALQYVGANAEAEQFYRKTINDTALPKDVRSNLIEDLNENGFADPRNITGDDLPLIERRLALIEQLSPSAMDAVNAAAFKEAHKDLVNMRRKVLQPATK